MRPHVGHFIQPPLGLCIQVCVVEKAAAVEEVLPQVANVPLHLALGIGSMDSAGPRTKLPVVRETQELQVLHQGVTVQPLILQDQRLL